jgi:hypothetical protein
LPTLPPEPDDDRRRKRSADFPEEYSETNGDVLPDAVDSDYPNEPTEGLMPNSSEYFYRRARLFPNVKGCG